MLLAWAGDDPACPTPAAHTSTVHAGAFEASLGLGFTCATFMSQLRHKIGVSVFHFQMSSGHLSS